MASATFNSSIRGQVFAPLFSTIAQHGRLARNLASEFDSLHGMLARFSTHVYFLSRCRQLGIVPDGLRLRFTVTNRWDDRWKAKCESELVTSKLRYFKSRMYQVRAGIELGHSRLRPLLPTELLSRLEACSKDTFKRVFEGQTETKKRKFMALCGKRNWEFTARLQPHQRPTHVTPTQLREVPDPPPKVINCSEKPLKDCERAVLELGPKFGLSGHPTPLADLAARVELAAQSLANKGKKEESESFRVAAISLVKQLPAASKSNISKDERNGLISLRKDKSRFCLRADKSETIVVMDRRDYEEKVNQMVGTADYQLLKKTGRKPDANCYPAAANRFVRKLQEIFITPDPGGGGNPAAEAHGPPTQTQTQDPEDGDDDPEPRGPQARLKRWNPRRYYEYRSVYKSHGAASPAHALPKTHKLGKPPETEEERVEYVQQLKLRLIAPAYTSVDVNLCKHLTYILGCLPRPAHSLNSLENGIGLIQRFRPGPATILVSFDIVGMYPSIDVGRSCAVVQRRLEQFEDLNDLTTLSPADIASLLEWCFNNTFLQIGDQWYQQKRGLAIGKSISSVVAELFMQELEERIMLEAEHKPGLYCRWVDDTLASWDHGLELLREYFLPFLNSLDPGLEWTVEIETSRRINFLDVSIFRHDTWLGTSVFRKASNTLHFIPAQSHHPWAHKQAAIRHAVRRAFVYCNTAVALQEELDTVSLIFARNGYSFHTVCNVIQKVKAQMRALSIAATDVGQGPGAEEPMQAPHSLPIKVGIPYLGPWSLKLQRLGIRHQVFFAMSNRNSVLRAFPSAKVPMSSAILGGSVYQLTCKCPDGHSSVYVGQSSVPLAKRMEWHEKDWEKARGSFSAHKAVDGHAVGFESVQIIAQEENYPVRVVLEALHIMRLSLTGASVIANPNLENRDGRRINKSDGIRLSPLWGPIAKNL